jgi:hypothetical protein
MSVLSGCANDAWPDLSLLTMSMSLKLFVNLDVVEVAISMLFGNHFPRLSTKLGNTSVLHVFAEAQLVFALVLRLSVGLG